MNPDIGITVAALLSIMIFTFVIKQNLLFQIAEHIFVGTAVGYTIAIAVKNINTVAYTPLLKGEFTYFIPIILGVLLFSRFFKGYLFVSRWPIALLTGVGTGLVIRGYVEAQLRAQILGTIKAPKSINDVLIILMTICTLSYFIFSKPLINRPITMLGKIGRYVMMMAFGASFGGTVMTRMVLLIGRIRFLLVEWLGLGI